MGTSADSSSTVSGLGHRRIPGLQRGHPGTGTIGPVTGLDRLFQTGFIHRDTSGTVPVGTRTAIVGVTLRDRESEYWGTTTTPTPTTSRSGSALHCQPRRHRATGVDGRSLDHVFMVYMENKGFTEVVGSPNAPYLNSLINTYGFGTNYFGLTHPSDPNYYPIIGGSDFGFNWHCPAAASPPPTLVDNIEAAGLNWAGYAEGGGGYLDPTDRLPFLAFSDIFNDPARVESHIFDISQMGVDLNNPATAPNYVWFAANDEFNMEGPTDFPFGALMPFIGFLDPRHHYKSRRSTSPLGARTRYHEFGHLAEPQRREAPSSSRSTRTTTTFHWASATKATTSSRSSSRHRAL